MQIKTETIVGIFILASIGAFFYLTLHVGIFRFDRGQYNSYSVYFKDITGLTRKSDVKIAGVKVGWVDSIKLSNSDLVKTDLRVLKDYKLNQGSYAIIKQEGFLGSKVIEIVPGDPNKPILPEHSTLLPPNTDVGQTEDLLSSFKKISANFEQITDSFKIALSGSDNAYKMQEVVNSFNSAINSIARVSENLEKIVSRNDQNVSDTLRDLKQVLEQLKDRVPHISDHISGITEKLNHYSIPQITENINNLSLTVNNEFLPKLQEDASNLVSDFNKASSSINDLTNKINNGCGIAGKLVTDEDLAQDLKSAIESIRNTFDKIDRLGIVVDGWVESMQGPSCGAAFDDAKGFFNLRVYPTEDYFYLVGGSFSQKGYITRKVYKYEYFDENCKQILPSQFLAEDKVSCLGDSVSQKNVAKIERDSFRLNLQFGKIYRDIAIRGGLFEGTFGVAVDYDIPFYNPDYKWVSTFEVYDFNGRNRFSEGICENCERCDNNDSKIFRVFSRPHLKWLNKVFITPNLYFTFGADDFASKHNKNAFAGIGIRFADDDLKYLLTSIPG